jgi:23S rRNA (uracil1939-C5)-methyltransferase
MDFKNGQIIELEITSFGSGGAGIGRYEGMAVFVEKTVPGDKVKASFTKIKKNFAEAKLEEIVKPSGARVEPPCKYAHVCGGCPLMIMSYEKQLEIKRQQIIDAMERIGKIKNPNVLPIEPCAFDGPARQPLYFRNKMEFSFGYDDKMKFSLGLHMPGRKFDILDLHECHLESVLSYKIVNFVREFTEKKGWLPFKYSVGEGFLKALFIREGKRTNEMMIVLNTSDQLPPGFEKAMEEFKNELLKFNELDGNKKITSIYWMETISKIGVPRAVKDHLIYGKKTLTEKLILKNGDELDFEILPQAFFQVNTFQAEVLYSHVVDFATEENHPIIFDLFCGTGTIGLFLAKHAEKVIGIELNEDAVKAARENAQSNKIFNIDFYSGDTSRLLNVIKDRPSLIVVDPPRAGLTEKIVEKINNFGPKKIIYVSCNPSTQARDINWLTDYGYHLQKIQPVDMFPHSNHIENVAVLLRGSALA